MSDFKVDFAPSQGVMKFIIEGRLDTNKAVTFTNAVISNAGSVADSTILIDCEKLEYVSSSGLRAFLSIKKKTKLPVKLINVSQEVYDIMEVTGFSQILDISRAVQVKVLTEIQGQIIGESDGITIYKLSNDTILKLYPAGKKLEDVEHDISCAKAALLSGVPALISYYTVIYEGRYGSVYEMPNAKTISSLINFQSWKLKQYASEMGSALRQIHECEPEVGILPKTSDLLILYARQMRKYYTGEEIEKFSKIVLAVPEKNTFVYGNYHAGNVFIQDDEIILVNMSGISTGNPIFDLGKTYAIHVFEADICAKKLTGLDPVQSKQVWDFMIKSYFGSEDIKSYEEAIKAAGLLCLAILPAIVSLPEGEIKRIVSLAKNDIFPAADSFINILAGVNF